MTRRGLQLLLAVLGAVAIIFGALGALGVLGVLTGAASVLRAGCHLTANDQSYRSPRCDDGFASAPVTWGAHVRELPRLTMRCAT
jgi:hypothetical protein